MNTGSRNITLMNMSYSCTGPQIGESTLVLSRFYRKTVVLT